MPVETATAVEWALQQTIPDEDGGRMSVTPHTRHQLVECVRQYFNDHGIPYEAFSAADLEPYLAQ